jgi:hypothetical protein
MQEAGPTWRVLREITVRNPETGERHEWILAAADDEKPAVGLCVDGHWTRHGSERSVRGALARVMWMCRG